MPITKQNRIGINRNPITIRYIEKQRKIEKEKHITITNQQ